MFLLKLLCMCPVDGWFTAAAWGGGGSSTLLCYLQQQWYNTGTNYPLCSSLPLRLSPASVQCIQVESSYLFSFLSFFLCLYFFWPFSALFLFSFLFPEASLKLFFSPVLLGGKRRMRGQVRGQMEVTRKWWAQAHCCLVLENCVNTTRLLSVNAVD